MSLRTMPQMLAACGAPSHDTRKSWGAVRPSDGTVFLSVWQDRTKTIGDKRYVQLTHLEKYGGDPGNFGYCERLRHVDMIYKGAKCFMVMCIAKNVDAISRTIKKPIHDFMYVGGELIMHEGEWYMELASKISPEELFVREVV